VEVKLPIIVNCHLSIVHFILVNTHQNNRLILFAGFRKKNNGQMIMDNGQLLEASLPLNKEK